MVLSIFLAKVLGLYLVILGLWLFIRCRSAETEIQGMMASPGAMTMGGILGLIFGLLIVVSHNVWHLDWTVIITIIGYLALTKALFNLFFHETAMRFFNWWVQHRKVMMISNVVTLIMGLFLLYHGFIVK
jgi:hypothetical protein